MRETLRDWWRRDKDFRRMVYELGGFFAALLVVIFAVTLSQLRLNKLQAQAFAQADRYVEEASALSRELGLLALENLEDLDTVAEALRSLPRRWMFFGINSQGGTFGASGEDGQSDPFPTPEELQALAPELFPALNRLTEAGFPWSSLAFNSGSRAMGFTLVSKSEQDAYYYIELNSPMSNSYHGPRTESAALSEDWEILWNVSTKYDDL